MDPRNNLPLQPTSFVGRKQEIDELLQLLTSVRLVTLTGAGGSGKTRLALEVARRAAPLYADGVWLVELTELNDDALVARAVSSVLQIAELPGRPLLDVLVNTLRNLDLLLILDNCEHLVAASAELIEHLISRCPRVRILATSRERLNVAGETLWRVPPLSLPSAVATSPTVMVATGLAERAGQSEAVDLFVQRARSVEPQFRLTDENAAAVASVCQRLDGLPLAIELAAARVSVLTPQQIASRLDDCFRLLSRGARRAPERQRTLRATLDWSYELLSPSERWCLACLSIFSGGWTLDAAEAVCAAGELEAHEVLDVLSALVDKSLVQTERNAGEARYRLLETIRNYGRERLENTGQAREVRSRHRDWYLALAERADPQLAGAQVRPWLDRLDVEHDNLRGALDWCLATDPELSQRLVGCLWLFWERRGYLTEGREWMERALANGEGSAVCRTSARARALLGAGYLARDQGDTSAAWAWFDESLAISREIGDPWGIGSGLRGLGLLAQSEGNGDHARLLFEEAVSLFRASGRTGDIGWTLRNLGTLAQVEGDYVRANALFEESLPILRQLGDQTGTARVLGSLGILARIRGDHRRAAALLEESRDLLLAVEDKRGVGMAFGALASLARIQGDQAGARALLQQGIALGREMGDRGCVAHGLGTAGVLAEQQGDHTRAAQMLGAATAIHPHLLTVLEVDERADVDAALVEAEAAMGADSFARAWARGQAMTVDEAIELVMGSSGIIDDSPAADRSGASDSSPRRRRLPGGLTEREAQVLRLVAQGKTNREIADDLVLSEYTVMRHLSNIFRKVGISSRAAAVSFGMREGIS